MISGCRVVIGLVASSVFSSSLFFVGKNFLVFHFFPIELLYVSLQKIMARLSFAIDYPGWVDEFNISI